MRVNPTLMAHQHPTTKGSAATGDMKRMYGGKGKGSYALPKDPHAATPLVTNQMHNPVSYAVGDGDPFHAPMRPGADHSHLKSRGFPC